ncbi:MAG TPA: hypothetical protein VIX91_10525 [Candidatus Acidoferrum sp.]
MVVLFLATARVIHAIQDAPKPEAAVEVTAIGHQFWWEFRYPALDVVTAKELLLQISNAESFDVDLLHDRLSAARRHSHNTVASGPKFSEG